MKKEEILEKSRQSQDDEGVEYATDKGRKIGFTLVSLLVSVFILLSAFFARTDQTSTIYALCSLYWTYCYAESYAKYQFTKTRISLVISIIGGIAAISISIAFIVVIFR